MTGGRQIESILSCRYCGVPVTGVGSTPQAAQDHAVLLGATHLKNDCKIAPQDVREAVKATISTASRVPQVHG